MTARLRFLLSKAKPGFPLWDIGCDHGLLGKGASDSGLFSDVHFVDPVQHCIQALSDRLGSRPACFFHAVPAQEIALDVYGNVVIAGMGGDRIYEILSVLSSRGILRAERLILSPHKDLSRIEDFIRDFGRWRLVEHGQVLERGRVREVFVLEPLPS